MAKDDRERLQRVIPLLHETRPPCCRIKHLPINAADRPAILRPQCCQSLVPSNSTWDSQAGESMKEKQRLSKAKNSVVLRGVKVRRGCREIEDLHCFSDVEIVIEK